MSINPQIQSYLSENFDLVRSIIVKSSMVAQSINNWVYGITGTMPDPNSPQTWKYYQNLAGNYTPYDPMIYIYSLDTGEQMEFTVENLQNSPVTFENYYPGSFFFNQLINEYPLQQDLILSIIYPVDIDVAIAVEDGFILNYNSSLVEENEYTLMSDLNTWSRGFHVRWNVNAFSISDEYYPAAQKAIYYISLLNKLINLRLLRCHTIEAHSFHVTQYLASHNGLSQYIDYLTLSQRLYLYRNINHFRRHSGFKKIFIDLIELLATPNNVLIGAFNLHKTNTFNNSLAVSNFYLDNLSGIETGLISDTFSLSDTLDLEEPLVANNQYYINKDINTITNLTQYTLENSYDTKIIYSNNLAIGTPFSFTLEQTIFNQLLYIAYFNELKFNTPQGPNYANIGTPKYNAIALIQLSNGRYIYLTPLDAVYLLLYITSLLIGNPLIYLPTLTASSVMINPVPPFSNFESYLDYSGTYKWSNIETVYNEAISLLPNNNSLNSIDMFYNYCETIYNARVSYYYYTAQNQRVFDRGYLEGAFRSLFSDYSLPPIQNNVLYDVWLADRYIDLSTYTTTDLVNLYIQVFQNITNYNLASSANYLNTIESVIAIIKNLASYTLQFITDFTDQITSLDIKDLRYSNIIDTYPDYRYIKIFNLTGIEVPRLYDRLTTEYYYDLNVSGSVNFTLSSPNNNLNKLTQQEINELATYAI